MLLGWQTAARDATATHTWQHTPYDTITWQQQPTATRWTNGHIARKHALVVEGVEENNIDGLPTLPNKSTGGSNPDEAIVYFWAHSQNLMPVLMVKSKKKFCNWFSIL